MKKIYLSLLLLGSSFVCADDISITKQEQNELDEDSFELTENEPNELQDSAIENEQDSDNQTGNLDDDDFFGDSLDKMIEMGAVDEEIEVKPLPKWQVWLLRIGSGTLAKLEVLKNFIAKQYSNAKYMAALVWAKATGKKLPKHKRMIKKHNNRYKKTNQ